MLAVHLEYLATLHDHLCPRQVLGVRIGMLAADLLGLPLPQTDKRVFTIVETDGCFADGVSAASGCTLGHRTMRLADYGKVAATFIDTETSAAFRIAPRAGVRELAHQYAPDATSKWHAQLAAYQVIPADDLFVVQAVVLTVSLDKVISKPGRRVTCEACGEEILNEREIVSEDRILCRACAGDAYYRADSTQAIQAHYP